MTFISIFVLFVYCLVQVKSAISVGGDRDAHLGKTAVLIKEEPRKKVQQQDIFRRILPMLATPFILQTTLLPLVLMSMKFMLLNSMFLGKLGLFLWAVHLFRTRNDNGGGLYSHNVNMNNDHNEHPGHQHLWEQH